MTQETMEQIGNSNLRYIKAKEGDRVDNYETEEISKQVQDQIQRLVWTK